jgi:ABC-type Zn uptake system ZnuABC Zn-binding protein ZnuA
MRNDKVRVVLVQPYQNRKTAETVARQTGAAVLDVSQQPGAIQGTTTYADLMDHLVRTLVSGLQGDK